MQERLTEAFKAIPEKGRAIWNEYVWPVMSSVIFARPLHFAVTRFKAGIEEGDKVLELGSGYPWYEIYAGKVGEEGLFVALDINPTIQRRSKHIGRFIDKFLRRKEKPTVNHLVASVNPNSYLPFPDDTFDHVLVNEGPYYPKEVLRVLKPGGKFLISYAEALTFPVFTSIHYLLHKDSGFENVKTFPGAPTTFIPAMALLYWRGGDLPALFLGFNWYISAKKPVEQETKL